MFYVMHFRNSHGKATKMVFQLHRSRAAQKFIQLVQDDSANGRTVNPDDGYTFDMDHGRNTTERISLKLNENINDFNAIQADEFGFRIEPFTFSGNPRSDRRQLNEQHADFEFLLAYFYERKNRVDWPSEDRNALIKAAGLDNSAAPRWNSLTRKSECEYLLKRINRLIHQLEWKLDAYYNNDTSILSASISYIVQGSSKVRISKAYYKYFTLGSEFGSLMMSYATTGKNLSSLYLDNDLAYLEKGGRATPQQYISSGVLALFNGRAANRLSENTSHSHESRKAAFDEWFKANNIARFGYAMDCESNCLGFIPLGMYLPTDPLDMNSPVNSIVEHYREHPIFSHYELVKTLAS